MPYGLNSINTDRFNKLLFKKLKLIDNLCIDGLP